MSRIRRVFFVTARLAVAAAALVASAAPAGERPAWLRPKADYVAHTVMEADGRRMTGRVWASGDKERRELEVDGRTHVMILRRDRDLVWMLMPEQRMYLEQPLGAQDRLAGADLAREALGAEAVNGAAATKYRVHGTAADGHPFEGTLWLTDQDIPVRVVTGKGPEHVRIELDRLSVGFVDPARFELPRGWKRFELPGPASADLDALRRREAPADR
jgi:hypothetical protein